MTSKMNDPYLRFASDILDDIERTRVAQANRLLILTRSEADIDGQVRGFGLDIGHPDVARLAAMVDMLETIEKDAIKGLQKTLKQHPLHDWIVATKGIGPKQGARLLAAIGGDPYWNDAADTPRTVSALWAYCGLHVVIKRPRDPEANDTQPSPVPGDQPAGHPAPDALSGNAAGTGGDPGQSSSDTQNDDVGVAPRRQRGVRANWSTIAKTRAYLVATSCLKMRDPQCRPTGEGDDALTRHVDECGCSPFRITYDRRKAHTIANRPDWTDGHRHLDALRITAKDILRCMWREARLWHIGTREGSPKDDQP